MMDDDTTAAEETISTTNETPEPLVDQEQVEEPASSENDGKEERHRRNSEAAKYRTQLRDTQSQLEASQSRLRSFMESMAASDLSSDTRTSALSADAAKDLVHGMNDEKLSALFQDGHTNPDALDSLIDEISQEKPYMMALPRILRMNPLLRSTPRGGIDPTVKTESDPLKSALEDGLMSN